MVTAGIEAASTAQGGGRSTSESSASTGPNPVLRCASIGSHGITNGQAVEPNAKPSVNTGFLTGDHTAMAIRSDVQISYTPLLDKKLDAIKSITDPNKLRELLAESMREAEQANLQLTSIGPSSKAPLPYADVNGATRTQTIAPTRVIVASPVDTREIDPKLLCTEIEPENAPRRVESSQTFSKDQLDAIVKNAVEKTIAEFTSMNIHQSPSVESNPTIAEPVPRIENLVNQSSMQSDPMLQLIYSMMQENKQDRELARQSQERDHYLRAMQSLSMISGNEGRSFLSTYFRTFEDTTALWDDRLRASLLSSKLEGSARVQFDALGLDAQTSYHRIKESLMNGGTNPQTIRANAQFQLMTGLVQGENELFLNFGKRLLRVTRDSLHTEATDSVVEEQAIGYLLSYITDPSVRNVVASLRSKCNYHELLDQTVSLMKLNETVRPRRVATPERNRTDDPPRDSFPCPRPIRNRWQHPPKPVNNPNHRKVNTAQVEKPQESSIEQRILGGKIRA